MEITEYSPGSVRESHERSGAYHQLSRDQAGVVVDPAVRGWARKLLPSSGLCVTLVDIENEIASSETVCPAGRQLTFFLDGGLCDYRIEGQDTRRIAPGGCLVAASPEPFLCHVVVEPGRSYRFVSISFDDAWAADLVQQPSRPDDPLMRLMEHGSAAPFSEAFSLSRDLRRLAGDFFSLRPEEACGALIAEARALEIIAGIADAAAGSVSSRDVPTMSRADIERLNEAKRLIEEEPETSFTLPVLARQVGINVNKLKAGFKTLFGTTVGEHSARIRMAYAYNLLAVERLQVASVAYRLGYSPAHFSMAFRRRYGIQPSRVGPT